MLMRTRYPVYPHPVSMSCTSAFRALYRWSSLVATTISPHSSAVICRNTGGPTRSDGKYTSHGCSPASADKSCQTAPVRTSGSPFLYRLRSPASASSFHLNKPLLCDSVAQQLYGSGSMCTYIVRMWNHC